MPAEQIITGLQEPQGIGEEPLHFFTNIYLLFLQGLFKQFPEGSYRWSDDEKLTEIHITDQAPFPKDKIEARPAIVTLRGPAQFANLSLDNLRSLDFSTGMKERTDLVACTMSLACIARMGLEAQRIAWIVFRHLRTFKTMLQRAGIHKIGDEISIGPESPPGAIINPEADSEMVMITVQSPFFFQWTEKTTPIDAVTLGAIEAHMGVSLSNTKGFVIRPPTIRGRVVQGIKS